MRFFVNGAKPIKLLAKLEGGHTLLASLWYDEEGPPRWHLEPAAVRPGETEWSIGPLAKQWKGMAQTMPEYEARGPHQQYTFQPTPGATSYWFWLDLRAASNTGVAEPRYIVDIIVDQGGPPIDASPPPAVVVMPGGVTSYQPASIEFVLQ